MWSSERTEIESGQAQRVVLSENDRPLPYAEVIRLWRASRSFCGFFASVLSESPFPAYLWETPPVSKASLDQLFEFVLLSSPQLDGAPPDRAAFQGHFSSNQSDDPILTFPNLGHDAILVVPRPLGPDSVYAHLGAFTKTAPESQQLALWQAVGCALESSLGSSSIWLSTAGLGVYWLHVRLDSQPKYYSHAAYRRLP